MRRSTTFNPSRRRFLKGLLFGGTALGAVGGAAAVQVYQFGVTRYTRPLPGLQRPVTVAFLTDLHYGPFIGVGSVRQWVSATNELRPDLILLGGDQVDTHLDSPPAPLLAELSRLQAPLGVFGVWGNHDYRSFTSTSVESVKLTNETRPEGEEENTGLRRWNPRRALHPKRMELEQSGIRAGRADALAGREELRRAFQQAGVNILRNEGVAVRGDLHVSGIDDLWYGEPDLRAALSGAGTQAKLLISHNPDILPELPAGLGLVLSGHTHGGQVRLPWLGAPVVPSKYGQRYAMGWVQGAHDTPAFVSRGLGVSGLPVRHLCQPELALLTLVPAQSG